VTGQVIQLAVARPVFGLLLPIGLLLLALAIGAALSLRDRGRKARGFVGVLGVILAGIGIWALVSKPKLEILDLKPYPLTESLRSGEPCPESIEVLAVVRGKGGPEHLELQLSSFPNGKIVAFGPMFEQSEKESHQAFGPIRVSLPGNPPRTGVPVILRAKTPKAKKPIETSKTALLKNAGCTPRR
jgi:hypothetical protein